MLHPVEGTLAEDPKKHLKTVNGRPFLQTILNTGKDSTLQVPIAAWDHHAEQLAEIGQGTYISFVGVPTPLEKNKERNAFGFEIVKIDDNGLLILATDKLLSDFAKSGQKLKSAPSKANEKSGIRRTAPRRKSIESKENELSL